MKFFFTLWFFALLTIISADNCRVNILGTPVPATTCLANGNKCVAGLGGGIIGTVLTCDAGYYCCSVPDSGLDDGIAVPCKNGGINGLFSCKNFGDNNCALGTDNSDCPSGQYCCTLAQ